LRRFGPVLAGLGLTVAVLGACGSDAARPTTSTSPSMTTNSPSASSPATASSAPAPTSISAAATAGSGATTSSSGTGGKRCLVRLHGKSGTGADPVERDGYVELSPTGNAEGWGARQWLYFPADRYNEARDVVTAAVDSAGCAAIVVDGFSNGAAFAGELYCHGETFAGRLLGVVVDDPVPDHGSAACAPAPGVRVALYWTGGLDDQAKPGASCEPIDWTCDGGSMVGIDAYAAALGATIQKSPNTTHEWYRDAPETVAWLTAG